MELLYLWIEDYKNIHHQGFNFSPKYRFEFKPEFRKEADGKLPKDKEGKDIFEVIGGTLKDKKLDSISENFFEPSQEVKDAWNKSEKLGTITNITAIVGANGAGKSNLLDFIKDILREEFAIKKNRKSYRFVCIFQDEQENYHYSKNIKVSLITNQQLTKFTASSIESFIYSFIFYSNQLTPYRNEQSDPHFEKPFSLISISLREILEKESSYERMNKEINTINQNKGKEFLTAYFLLNLKTHLDFIKFLKRKGIQIALPFNLPEFLILSISPNYNFAIAINSSENILQKFKNLFECYTKIIFDLASISNKYELVIRNLKLNHINRIFQSIASKFEEKHDLENNFTNWESYKTISQLDDKIEKFLKLQHENDPYLRERILHINFEKFLEKFKEYYKDVLEQSEIYLQDKLGNEKINITDVNFRSNLDLFSGIYESYFALHYDYFDISWQGLSSGEEAFLSIYSRFYSAITPNFSEYNYYEESSKINLLILIDEGEVGFHPEWQRKYLKYLIDFFPQIYHGARTQIQIILTTHSPFLASDLPKENIIFLKKGGQGEIIESDKSDANGKCIVFDGLKKDKTFGANIHTLLSDGFFLNEGLIGEFAKGKINEVIKAMEPLLKYPKEKRDLEYESRILEKEIDKKLKETEIEHLDKEYESQKEKFNKEKGRIKKIIDAIGEPIVQDKLLQMYYTIESKDAKEAQIKFHQEKIRKLEENDSNKNS